jgi:hypothetical protein
LNSQFTVIPSERSSKRGTKWKLCILVHSLSGRDNKVGSHVPLSLPPKKVIFWLIKQHWVLKISSCTRSSREWASWIPSSFGRMLSSSKCCLWDFQIGLAFSYTPTHLDKNISAATKKIVQGCVWDQKYWGSLLILTCTKVLCSKVEENGWAQLSNISSCLMMFIAHCNRHESTLLWKSHWVNWWLTIVRFLKEKVHTTVKEFPFKSHYYEVSYWKGEK